MAKKRFKLEVFNGCSVHATMKIKAGKATVKFYFDGIEVEHQEQLESINHHLIDCLLIQAKTICVMYSVILYNY